MSAPVACPVCKTRYTVADNLLGRTIPCKKCQESFVARRIPAGEDPPTVLAGRDDVPVVEAVEDDAPVVEAVADDLPVVETVTDDVPPAPAGAGGGNPVLLFLL